MPSGCASPRAQRLAVPIDRLATTSLRRLRSRTGPLAWWRPADPLRIPIQTPVSPDGRYVLTAVLNLFGPGVVKVIDTATDTVAETLACEPGCHGANFGAKQGGGYYGYVTSQYTNALQVVDATPPAGGLPELAGKVFLGSDGVGGQGVLPIPIAYEGWVERAVAAHAPFTSALTGCQRRPILYVTHPDQCRPGD
jgi:hypothetical protein